MNKTLIALMTKLTWQLADVSQQFKRVDAEYSLLQSELNRLQEEINQACTISAIIHPEQEIARLNFIIQRQQHHGEFMLKKQEYVSLRHQLEEHQIRLKTELTMLEKYQEKQKKGKENDARYLQEKTTEEWVLQQRGKA